MIEPRSPHFQDLPDAIKRALAIEPDRRSGTIRTWTMSSS